MITTKEQVDLLQKVEAEMRKRGISMAFFKRKVKINPSRWTWLKNGDSKIREDEIVLINTYRNKTY